MNSNKKGFTDLDEELEQLGYGNQWEATENILSPYRESVKHKDLARLQEWIEADPDRRRESLRRSQQAFLTKKLNEAKDRLGYSPCVKCGKQLSLQDLRYEREACAECRKLNRKPKTKKNT